MNVSSFLTLAQTETTSGLIKVFSDLDEGLQFVLLMLVLFCVSGLVFGIIATVRQILANSRENELKRELIQRGMSAEEIAIIIKATASNDEQ